MSYRNSKEGARLRIQNQWQGVSSLIGISALKTELAEDQLTTFAREGYLVVRDVVDESLLVAVDAEVDSLLERDPPPPNEWNRHGYAPPPEVMPASVRALHDSGALTLAEQLVVPHRLENLVNHVNVVVNYPGHPHCPGAPHLDMHDGVTQPPSFTVLVGIYLGDESADKRGNLYVWPGSHFDHAQLFNERGVDALQQTFGHGNALDPPMRLRAASPVPVLARRGDVVLAHFMLGHNASGNETERMRRMLYFRLSAAGHNERWRQTFLDPLTEYPRLRHRVSVVGG